ALPQVARPKSTRGAEVSCCGSPCPSGCLGCGLVPACFVVGSAHPAALTEVLAYLPKTDKEILPATMNRSVALLRFPLSAGPALCSFQASPPCGVSRLALN